MVNLLGVVAIKNPNIAKIVVVKRNILRLGYKSTRQQQQKDNMSNAKFHIEFHGKFT